MAWLSAIYRPDLHRVVARLRVGPGEEVSCDAAFAADQWLAMQRCVDAARVLSRTPLLAKSWTYSFDVSARVGRGPQIESRSAPDREQLRALLLVLRPFLEERGPLSFVAMRKLLHRRLTNPGFARYLDRQRDIFKGRRLTRSKALSDVRLPQSDEAIEKWLGDPRAASSQVPWTTDAIKALAIVLLLEKSRANIDVADAIFAIRTGAVVVPLPGDH